MPNAKNLDAPPHQKLLVLGRGGSGKSSQLFTLPGRKFAYIFDPGTLPSIIGADIDYETFLPDVGEADLALRGFNKVSKSDAPPVATINGKKTAAPEPVTYLRWSEDWNEKTASGFFKNYDWLCLDSLTLLSSAIMDRQLYINGRWGDIEDRADYRIVGAKIASVFRSICALPINLYCTGHLNSYEDEKTHKIETQLNLPGKSRLMLPLLFTNIWEARIDEKLGYAILTKAESRGFQEIRTSLRGLAPIEDATIKDFNKAELYGIGGMLKKATPRIDKPRLVETRSLLGTGKLTDTQTTAPKLATQTTN